MAASRFEPKLGTADIVQAAARLGSTRIILADKLAQRLYMRVRQPCGAAPQAVLHCRSICKGVRPAACHTDCLQVWQLC